MNISKIQLFLLQKLHFGEFYSPDDALIIIIIYYYNKERGREIL